MDRQYSINVSAVVSDVIDGEAIMMHQHSGDYFSADGVGCLIWQWIGEGRGRRQILDLLEARFAEKDAEIAAAVDSFMADLLAHKLVREVDEGDKPMANTSVEPPMNSGAVFVAPVLNVYSDMRDLLLLDPIHDVEEAAGWPMPKRGGARP
jgi:hypothetical protein